MVIRETKPKIPHYDVPTQPLESKGSLPGREEGRADVQWCGHFGEQFRRPNMNDHISSLFFLLIGTHPRKAKEPTDSPRLVCRMLIVATQGAVFLTLMSG